MERITQWDTNALIHESKFHQILHKKPEALNKILPPNCNEIASVIEQRQAYLQSTIDRQKLVEELIQSHQKRNAPSSSLQNIETLSQPRAYLVITGQQPGLLGGPLYTFYKILHTVQYARQLSEEHEAVFLPAFWNASEDDNRSEIDTLYWLGQDKSIHHYHWNLEQSQPYFTLAKEQLPLGEIFQQIRDSVQSTEFLEDVIHQIQNAYDKADSYPDFFDQLIWALFSEEGLIIIRPDDPCLRQQAIPLMHHEILHPRETSKAINQAGAILQQNHLPIQLHKKEERTSFFLLKEKRRVAVFHHEEGFSDSEGNRYTQNVMLQYLREHPEHFSPTAVLRPVLQDALFPTAAVVLGPNELAYHFLLNQIYDHHQVPRPALLQRFGCTLFETRERKHLDRYNLPPVELRADCNALLKRVAQTQNAENRNQYYEQIEKSVSQLFHVLKEEAQVVDPTIIKVLDKNENKIRQQIEQSENLLIRRKSEKDKTTANHIQSLQNALYPKGLPQERCFNIFFYWMKYGPDFLKNIKKTTERVKEREHLFLALP